MMLMARGLAFKLSHGQPVPLKSDAFDALGHAVRAARSARAARACPAFPWAVLVMLAVVIVFAIVLTRTRFGRYVLALGGNEEAARLAGINVRLVKTFVYVISGGCAALAGMLLMARFSSGSPQTGVGSELQSIAAVVVGGTSLMGGRGSVVASFFGALLIGVLNNVMNLLNIESYTQDIVLGARDPAGRDDRRDPQAHLRPLMQDFDDLSIGELRKRRSAKWTTYPPDVCRRGSRRWIFRSPNRCARRCWMQSPTTTAVTPTPPARRGVRTLRAAALRLDARSARRRRDPRRSGRHRRDLAARWRSPATGSS